MTAPPATLYHRLERLHLRQWVLRIVPPLAVVATNGAGRLDRPELPRFDAPLAAFGLTGGAAGGAACAVSLAGAAAVAVAAVLRVGAKGVLVRKTTVTTAGVYGLVRHPFYLASLVGAVGVLLVAGPLGAVVAAAWTAAALPVFLVTVRGEEDGLRRIHGAAWDAYAARVPRLLPTGSRPAAAGDASDGAPVRVTWANLVAEGEPPRWLRFASGALVVTAFRLDGTPAVAAAVAAAVAWAASHLVPRARR